MLLLQKLVNNLVHHGQKKEIMKLGIIGAMDVEVAHLKKVMTIESTLKKCSMEFCEGTLEGLDVVVVRCGIGKINAALCTQILVDDFNVDAVLNTGIAGSLNNDIEVGDMVVSENVVHHDFDLAPFGYKRGQLPGFKGVGFKADKQLVKLVTDVIDELDMCGLFTGTICSGDQFVDSIEKKSLQSSSVVFAARWKVLQLHRLQP